jgi:hypothetical protein
MTLRMTTGRGEATFVYDGDGMEARFTMTTADDEADLVAKLTKLLLFLRREGAAPEHTLAPVYPLPGTVPARDTAMVGMGWPKAVPQPPPFTGVAPIQPVPLADSIAQAHALGYELYDGNNTED